MTCPSRFELARVEAAGPPPADLTAHVERCGRCTDVMGELGEARRDLLGDDPIETARQSARRIAAAAADRRARRWRLWLPVGLAPVAAALMLFALVGRNAPSQETSRVKGPLVLELYCKRGESVFPVNEGADFVAGDRLRFAYTKAEPGHLMVFGVDDTGRVFPYYQDDRLAGMEVRPGSKEMLPGSIELDAHRGWERVFALWSARPLDEETVRGAVAAALAAAGGDVRKAVRLGLDVEQVSYLLRRP